MPQPPIADLPMDTASLGAVNHDRRRLGRVAVSSELIPLLRGTAVIIASQAPEPDGANAIISDANESDGISYQSVLDNDHADLQRSQSLGKAEDRCDEDSESSPARGILIALLLSVPLWVIIGSLACWIFG